MQLLLSMNDFTNFKQIGKGKDCVVYAASCEKLGGHSVVLKVSRKHAAAADCGLAQHSAQPTSLQTTMPCRRAFFAATGILICLLVV
jgi:hypothetical protein